MFLHLSVILSTGGGGAIPACIAGGIPACLAAGGCLLPGGLLQGVPALGGGDCSGESACSGGDACSSESACSGGVCSRGVPTPRGGLGDPPESRWLLLRTVRILLECILVSSFIFKKKELSPN